jgi:putative DNA primase/helicase
MTTTLQTTSHEKAHAFSAGFTVVMNSFDAVTRQGLADDKLLLKLFDLLPPNSLLSITDDLTTNDASLVPTAGTIALRLHDKQGDIVGAVFYTPNSKAKPLVIDPTGYGAIVMGDLNKANEVIAFDSIDDGIEVHSYLMASDKTIIASPQKTNQHLKKMAQHWSSGSLLTVPITLDNKGLIDLLAGVKAQALVTDAHIVTKLEASESYEYIKEQAIEIIELADTAHYPEWRKDKAPMLNAPMIDEDGRFELYHDGLFFVRYNLDDPANITFKFKAFVCSPIEVIAKARDINSGTWGRLLQWRDDDNEQHQWSMPLSLLQGDAREYRRELASQGLSITTNPKQRSYLDTYIQDYPIHKRALCVDKLGWHGEQYILANGSIGGDDKQITVYQSANAINSTLAQQGTLAQWRDELCKKLADQSRFVFSIACAFAGQLLEPLGSDSGGFHLLGSSSMGKSLSLKVASSVWGKPDNYTKTWRSTDNALEGTASEYNDSFLPLDEISEGNPTILGNIIYMLGNGTGKGRSTTTGHNRIAKTWRIIFLSNGEKTVEQEMAQAGKKTNAGVEVRVAHIDADAGKGLKTFDSLVLADTGTAQADKIKELSHTYYGSAGIAWLEYITNDKAATTATAKQLVNEFMSHYPQLAPQAHRVAKRFAIVAAAGEMATGAGITGWQAGQATTAVMTCLDNWLDNYGRDGEHEQRQIIKHIQAFIEQHGSSRFEPRHSHKCADFEPKTSNRVGYRNIKTGDYYFLMNTFDMQVCPPFNSKAVLQVLDDANLLMRNQGDRKAYRSPKTLFKNREPFYVVKADILSYETDKSIVTDVTDVTDHKQHGIDPVTHTKTATGRTGQKTTIC